jgi:hypothetical protein
VAEGQTVDTGAVAVPKKKSSEKRKFNTLVRMDDELCDMARVLATMRKTSMAELFADWLRPVVKREYEKEIAKEQRRIKGAGDGT